MANEENKIIDENVRQWVKMKLCEYADKYIQTEQISNYNNENKNIFDNVANKIKQLNLDTNDEADLYSKEFINEIDVAPNDMRKLIFQSLEADKAEKKQLEENNNDLSLEEEKKLDKILPDIQNINSIEEYVMGYVKLILNKTESLTSGKNGPKPR